MNLDYLNMIRYSNLSAHFNSSQYSLLVGKTYIPKGHYKYVRGPSFISVLIFHNQAYKQFLNRSLY